MEYLGRSALTMCAAALFAGLRPIGVAADRRARNGIIISWQSQ